MQKNDTFIERQIDLNLNLGEGYGHSRDYIEDELLPYVTSVNLASGAHTGDPAQIDRSLKRCKNYESLSIGALISYPDLVGYGLRKINLSSEELRATVIAQLGAVSALAKSNGYELTHVRTHGYLYNQMQNNYSVAETVAKAVQEFSKWIILVGPSGKVMDEVSSWTNIRISGEGRVDLRYRADGTLIDFDPEKDSNLDLNTIAERARNLIYKGIALTEEGEESKVKFETIHITPNFSNFVDIARLIHGMIVNPLPLKSIDYEPYLSEFI